MSRRGGLNGHHPDWGIETLLQCMPANAASSLNGHHPDWGIETRRMSEAEGNGGGLNGHHPDWGIETANGSSGARRRHTPERPPSRLGD